MSPAGAKSRRRVLWVYLLASVLPCSAAAGWTRLVHHHPLLPVDGAPPPGRGIAARSQAAGLSSAAFTRRRCAFASRSAISRSMAAKLPGSSLRARGPRRGGSEESCPFWASSLDFIPSLSTALSFTSSSIPMEPPTSPPPGSSAGNTSAVERLFALSISRLEVRHGEFVWNDQVTPLDVHRRGRFRRHVLLFSSPSLSDRSAAGQDCQPDPATIVPLPGWRKLISAWGNAAWT